MVASVWATALAYSDPSARRGDPSMLAERCDSLTATGGARAAACYQPGTPRTADSTAALGAFGLDALSSVAYGPDEILYVLLLAGSAGAAFDIPIAVAIVVLLAIVVTSYRQTIYAYPRGGGSYTVALDNLGAGRAWSPLARSWWTT